MIFLPTPGLPTKDKTSEVISSVSLFLGFLAAVNLLLSLSKALKDFIQGRQLNLTLESPYYKSLRSSLQSHSLRVTPILNFIFLETRLKLCWMRDAKEI